MGHKGLNKMSQTRPHEHIEARFSFIPAQWITAQVQETSLSSDLAQLSWGSSGKLESLGALPWEADGAAKPRGNDARLGMKLKKRTLVFLKSCNDAL